MKTPLLLLIFRGKYDTIFLRKKQEKKETVREQMKMFGKEEVKVFLKEKGIPFRWVEHKAVYTIEEMEELGLEKMEETAKNLFLRDQRQIVKDFLIKFTENSQKVPEALYGS